MNKILVTGRITNNLEIRKTQTNKSVVQFDLAVSRERKDDTGKYPVDYIRVNCWEQKAEFLSNYAGKGTLVGVTGRLETNSYVDKEGRKIKVTFILAESVEILRQPQEKTETTVDTKETELDDNGIFGGNNYGFTQDELPFY